MRFVPLMATKRKTFNVSTDRDRSKGGPAPQTPRHISIQKKARC